MTCRNAIDGMMKCSNQLGVGTILDTDWQEEKLFQRDYMCHILRYIPILIDGAFVYGLYGSERAGMGALVIVIKS